MLKIRRSQGRLIFNMGIHILGKDGVYTASRTKDLKYAHGCIVHCFAVAVISVRSEYIGLIYEVFFLDYFIDIGKVAWWSLCQWSNPEGYGWNSTAPCHSKTRLLIMLLGRTAPNTILQDPLLWRHIGRSGVLNHQPDDCLLNRSFRCRSKKISKLRVTGLCAGNSPGTGEFPAQRVSNAESVSIWWRHNIEGSSKVHNHRDLINVHVRSTHVGVSALGHHWHR